MNGFSRSSIKEGTKGEFSRPRSKYLRKRGRSHPRNGARNSRLGMASPWGEKILLSDREASSKEMQRSPSLPIRVRHHARESKERCA